jgi:iron complex transport system permease protein
VTLAVRADREVRTWHLAVGGGLLVVVALGSLFIGVSDITPMDLLRADDARVRIFLVSRVPRLLAILLAGTAMSVAGLIMQHLARNRFVAPSTAGTVEGASLGLLVATMCFGGSALIAKMGIAVVFALVGTVIFLQILKRVPLADVVFVPLVGIMYGGVIRSVTTFFAYRYDLLQTIDAWTNGDFSGVLRGRYELLWLAAGVTLVGYLYADRFTLAGMGKDLATNLGLRYERVLNFGIGLVSVITAVVVVTVGAIPFLGLIVPNLVTALLGDNLRRVLPVTALAGAGFVLISDIVGRTIRYPYEIPVGTVVGVVGSALFIVIVLRSRPRAG